MKYSLFTFIKKYEIYTPSLFEVANISAEIYSLHSSFDIFSCNAISGEKNMLS